MRWADVDDPAVLKAFFSAQRALREAGLVLAYHDRSDGGLVTTLLEMAFAGRVGLDIELPADAADPMAYLFNEHETHAEEREVTHERSLPVGFTPPSAQSPQG